MVEKPKNFAGNHSKEIGNVSARFLQNLGTIGADGQKKLDQSTAIVVGLGGLGGYVAEQLIRIGLGVVVGIDPDTFDETNLNRQILADATSVGLRKSDVARLRFNKINNAVKFLPVVGKIETVRDEVFKDAEVIFDCLDHIASKLYLENLAQRLGKPLVHGAVGGWYGQVAVVWPGKRFLSSIYKNVEKGIEEHLGASSFTPSVAAGIMVPEGLKIILRLTNEENIYVFFDLLTLDWAKMTG